MHRHPLAQALYIAATLIVIHYAVDAFAGAFPNVTPLRALKQSVTD